MHILCATLFINVGKYKIKSAFNCAFWRNFAPERISSYPILFASQKDFLPFHIPRFTLSLYTLCTTTHTLFPRTQVILYKRRAVHRFRMKVRSDWVILKRNTSHSPNLTSFFCKFLIKRLQSNQKYEMDGISYFYLFLIKI